MVLCTGDKRGKIILQINFFNREKFCILSYKLTLMDGNQADVSNGSASLLLTIILSIFSWLAEPHGIDLALKFVTAVGSLFSAFLAGRYYWYATKKAKKNLDDK